MWWADRTSRSSPRCENRVRADAARSYARWVS
jgi:hypothetical protein